MMDWLKKHDIILRVLCVLVAMMLWLYVVSSDNPEIETEFRGVKVTLLNKDQLLDDRSLTVLSGDNTSVSIRVKGRRDKIKQIGSSANISATADLSVITTAGKHQVLYNTVLPVDGVEIIGRTPTYITVETDKIVTTTVPVQATINGSAPAGYLYGNYKLSPANVVLEGPNQELSKIAAAHVTIDADGLTESGNWVLEYTLLDSNGEEVSVSNVTRSDKVIVVTLPVTKTKQVPLTVDLVSAPGINSLYASTRISPSSILVTGEDQALETFNQLTLGTVDLASVTPDTPFTLPITLPNGIQAIGAPENATVTVSFSGIATKDFVVTQFDVTRPNEGQTFTVENTSIAVQLRGHQSVLDLIDAGDITLVASFSSDQVAEDGSVSPGTYELPAEIRVSGGPEVAADTEYTLTVEVS